jgi:pyruvate dehydrogenase E2 component (dihydrolipoamide acetyltransferase)
MTQVIMPKMGDGMEEGTLLEWLKKDGEAVKSGEIIGTIQTDKATLELEAPGSGILTGMLLKGGETVPVGKPIALILKDGETAPADWGGGSGATAAAPAPEKEAPKAEATKSEPKQSEPVKEETPKASEPEVKVVSANDVEDGDGRVKASPLARKIAKEMGISLASVRGSGPGGRIVEKDVRGAQPAAVAASVASSEDTKVSLNRLRQITAQRTTQSKQQVPHFYVTVEVDVESIQSLRDQFEKQGAGKVTVNDFIIKACALALREMPIVNSTYQGDHLIQHGAVNIGMAVALDDGLTVPVIKNADVLTIREIGGQARELAKKARENRLSLDALSDSTFSISNMGMLDVDVFAAIINTPNAGILAVGTAKKQVVVGANDSLEIRQRMNITGSFDHRVVDGAVGAKFVNLVKDYLQNPTRLLS